MKLKSFLLTVLSTLLSFLLGSVAFATSGACSGHGGVDCSVGSDYDGSVVCFDGWRGSSVSYTSMVECSTYYDNSSYSTFVSNDSNFTSNDSGSGACSYHGGVDCSRMNFNTLNVVCKDGWEGSSVSYTDVCTKTTNELITFLSLAKCNDIIVSQLQAGVTGKLPVDQDGFYPCFENSRLSLAKQFFPKCSEAVNVIESYGTCVSYDEFCASNPPYQAQASICRQHISEMSSLNEPNSEVPLISRSEGVFNPSKEDPVLTSKLRGRILLQVEDHGEAWYVNPSDLMRYYMPDGSVAYSMMRSFGLGITDIDINKIPTVSSPQEMSAATNVCSSNNLGSKLKGKILLQVQQHGEAWYIDPNKCRKIYMKDGDAAYQIMRYLGLGITDTDLEKIPTRTNE